MENSIKLKVANGLLSALLVAPVFASATTALAQGVEDETVTESEREVVYHNDFSEDNYPDGVAVASGDAELEWTGDLLVDGNDNESGVWIRNRNNDYDGIDLTFDNLDLEEGFEYFIQVQGYVDSEEEIPEDADLHLETVTEYTWMDTTPAVAGETFELEASYTAFDGNDDRFRIKTNGSGIGLEFAVTDILITTEAVDDEDDSEEPSDEDNEENDNGEDESELDRLFFNDFTENATGAVNSGPEFQHLPDFNENQGALYVSDRTANWHGIDLGFEVLGMEPGYTYELTIRGYVDEEVEVPAGAQAFLQSPEGNYPFLSAADFEAGEEFVIEHSYTWTDETFQSFRVQSNEEGATVPFYITEVLVEWDSDQTPIDGEDPDEDPDPDLPPAEEFTLIDFEDGELNGFEGRSDNEFLVVTTDENNTEGGQYSLHVSNRQSNWNGPSLEVTDYINRGQEYRVSAWVRVDSDSSAELQLSTQVGEGSGAAYNTITSQTVSDEDGWVLLEGTYRYASLGGGYVTVYVEANNLVDFYIDDVNFEELDTEPIEVQDLTPIQEVYSDHFRIGNAVSLPDLESPRLDLLNLHHNLATAENAMKPGEVYSGREFDFSGSDALVERINEEGLDIHGHVLVWHQQSPEWLHSNSDGSSLTREEALENMETHIRTVMNHFGENVSSWDVVNEALAGDWGNPENWRGQLRDTGWRRAVGDDYVYEAFKIARQVADENGWHDMVLYYNDYNDHNQGKAQTMYYMIRELNEMYAEEVGDENAKLISGVGMQGHYTINLNPDLVEQSIERFRQLDIEIGITELDVTTLTENEYVESEINRQAYVYARLFQIFRDHSDVIDRVTFWGLNDANSWRSDRFPLLFDGRLQAKPAYYAVVDPDTFLENYVEEEIEANSSYAVYGTPEINAEIDDVWREAPVLNINRFQTAWQGANGTSRVLWDEDNLYVLFQVADGELDISAEDPWEQDSVEAFVNETGETTTSYVDGVGQYRVNYENSGSFNPDRYSEGFESAARVVGAGYIVEMAIPWKYVSPEAGHTIGFDLQINDGADGARQAVATWNDMTGQGFQDPSVFGNLTLINDLSDIDHEDEVVVVGEGEEVEVLPGQTIVIDGEDISITMPDDLPLGALITVELVDGEAVPSLLTKDGQVLIIAGDIVNVELILPDGQEEYEGEFTLTLGIDDEFIGEEVYTYYYDEEAEAWEYVGGDIADNRISVVVTGFSMYGVFALEDGEEPVLPETPNGDDSDDDTTEPDDDTTEDDTEVDDSDEDDATEESVVDPEDDESAERLPQTATVVWTVGLIGLTGMVSGLGLHFLRKKK